MNTNNDIENTINTDIVSEPLFTDNSEKSNRKNNRSTKKCKVLSYDDKKNILHIAFDEYGIQIANVKERPSGNEVTVTYKGEIGTENFSCSLK